MLGLKQSIDVGPMCGESNVIYWLTEHGHEPERPLVEHLFGLAKRREANFTDAELEEAVRTWKVLEPGGRPWLSPTASPCSAGTGSAPR